MISPEVSTLISFYGVGAGANYRMLEEPWFWVPAVLNRYQLHNNVLNAAGELVDVFEMSAFGRTEYVNTTYFTTERLEFAASTFGEPDAWSILALEDATPLRGTMHVQRVVEGWDATFNVSHMDVNVTGFDIRFEGPGAVIPAVPEPPAFALLLAGLGATTAMRRRARKYRR